MTHTEFITSTKRGKSTRKGWSEVISAIHRLKMSDKVLEEMYIGLSKISDRDLQKYLDSL
jgi:hypothetical protein